MEYPGNTIHKEQARVPYSFWILIINLVLIAGAFAVSTILAGAGADTKYAVLVTAPMIIGFTLLSSGVYAG